MKKIDKYEVIIGLEIHVQLNTQSKMFCSCDAKYFEKDPNSHVCPVCLGLPGTLPIPNRRALELTMLLGAATHCQIANRIKFDRKHYFYPDLPKGYQISQYDQPVCKNGYVNIMLDDGSYKKIELERIHQEEDVAKSFHEVDSNTGEEYTLIDFNKSGIPLAEIVTKPMISSPQEARKFAERIRQTVRYFGISDGDMEKGQMRCEPNVSVQKQGSWEYVDGRILPVEGAKLNAKVEIKNIGSISAVEKSLEYEIDRIIQRLEAGKNITQHTRGWDAVSGETKFQRSKESAPDYGYFAEPDIPLIVIEQSELEKIKKELTEIPEDKEARYKKEFGLSDYDISVITADRSVSEIYERFVAAAQEELKIKEEEVAKVCANWLTGIIFSYLNDKQKDLEKLNIDWKLISKLIKATQEKKITNARARKILVENIEDMNSLEKKVNALDKAEAADDDKIKSVVQKVLQENPKAVEDYRSGKDAVIGFLIGQSMRELKGMADPAAVTKIIKELLK